MTAAQSGEPEVITYPSSDGSSTVHAEVWPNTSSKHKVPIGVVQILHGTSEHVGRYDGFASFLASYGYVVCGHDQIGHGLTAPSTDMLGVMDPKNGAQHLVDDARELHNMMKERYGDRVPYFIFGHSLGSFVARVYAGEYGEELSGVVLSGTHDYSPSHLQTTSALADMLCATRGHGHRSAKLHKRLDGSNQGISNPRTAFDWLTCDEAIVDEFMNDDFCGFMMAASGYSAMSKLAYKAQQTQTVLAMPVRLPVLIVAGRQDPFLGKNYKNVVSVIKRMRDIQLEDIDAYLYTGMRHEVINEIEYANVYDDIINWMNSKNPRVPTNYAAITTAVSRNAVSKEKLVI